MKRPSHRLRRLAAACFAASTLTGGAAAHAQVPQLSESIVIGAWTFRPSVEARVRGEYRHDPFGYEGLVSYTSDAVLGDGLDQNLPPSAQTSLDTSRILQDAWAVSERVRLGLAVDRGPVTAVLQLQDARLLGGLFEAAALRPPGVEGTVPSAPGYGFAPYQAYIDVHSRSGRAMFLRLGRQSVKWGDGRLIGTNDFTVTGRSLDAVRAGFEAGDFDFEAMAALLGDPTTGRALETDDTDPSTADPLRSYLGSQLYGLKITGHFLPWLQVEATGLARVVRPPAPRTLTPSDTFVADLRVFGEHRGFRYSVEGAYQGGQVASYEQKIRPLEAVAVAGRLEWETALPGHLTFGAQGAYATGDPGTGSPDEKITRFDPILPDQTANHSRMSLYAWSNLVEAGGDLSIRPVEELAITAGYRFVGLADPKGRWITGALGTMGSDPTNDSMVLGHEVSAVIRLTPWDPITFEGGYGLFLLGDGGKNILAAMNRGASEMQNWGYLQATVKAP